jgi:hypothetical protein
MQRNSETLSSFEDSSSRNPAGRPLKTETGSLEGQAEGSHCHLSSARAYSEVHLHSAVL